MEEKILDILEELCETDEVRDVLNADLFDSGLLDSLSFAELLYAIESNFNVIIAPSEIERSDINTANKIISLVKERI